MGLTYAALQLRNLIKNNEVEVRALVDTGAMFMCVPEAVAIQLGFDPEEVSTQVVTLADGRQKKVPRIAPIEIRFAEDRTYVTEALVLGDEALMGVLPMEAMDLVVDPRKQEITFNPQHPNYSVVLVK